MAPSLRQGDSVPLRPEYAMATTTEAPPGTSAPAEFIRGIDPLAAISLVVGSMIGSGIFIVSADISRQVGQWGPGALLVVWFVTGAMIPIAGSAYTYGYATLGELLAWIIGWDLILEYLFAASTVAVGWSGYVVSFLKDLGITIPPQYTSAPYTHTAPPDAGLNVWRLFTEGWSSTGAVLNVPAMIIVALITILLIIGISESAGFNDVVVIIKLTVVFLFIGFGLGYINRENWEPFVPPAAGPGKYGWDGILRGAGVIFFAYIGFDAVSTAAQETKNPQRDMIAGWGPVPALGVYGAALATVLTRGLGFVVGLGLLWRRGGLRLDPNPAVARTIARIGLPTMLTGVLFSGIYMLLVRVVGRFGTPAIAALGVGHKIEGVTYMICIGFGLAAETIVGQNLGAGQPARAREAGWMTARIASIAPWAFGILFLLVPDTLVGVFTGDAAVIRDAALYLRAAGVAQLVIAYENVLEGGLTGAGYTLYTMASGVAACGDPSSDSVSSSRRRR